MLILPLFFGFSHFQTQINKRNNTKHLDTIKLISNFSWITYPQLENIVLSHRSHNNLIYLNNYSQFDEFKE